MSKAQENPVENAGEGTRNSWLNKLGIALMFLAFLSAVVTYTAMTLFDTTLNADPDKIFWLLNFDLVVFVLVCAVIGQRIFVLWRQRQRGIGGSALHTRLVLTFSIIAVIPAILMAAFSIIFFYYGIHGWFGQRVSTAVQESLIVAQSYLHEHQQVIKADALAMATDLNRDSLSLIGNPKLLQTVVNNQSFIRNFSDVIIFHSNGQILARTGLSFSLAFEQIPEAVLERAREQNIVLIDNDDDNPPLGEDDNKVRALVYMRSFGDVFLYVGRMVDEKVIDHIETAEKAVSDYSFLEGKKAEFQLAVAVIYIFISIMVLMAAIMLGLLFAKKFMNPVEKLIAATDRIRAGDFSVRLSVKEHKDDELARLLKAFNKMTSQIETQRGELISANRQLDERRNFIETILGNVSAGIIALNEQGQIQIINARAQALLGIAEKDALDKKINKINADFGSFYEETIAHDLPSNEQQLQIEISGQPLLNILARLHVNNETRLSILSFEDVSELISAQRKAAWAGVAKRIAHEIKNPLTPIQLSAERLKRKYLKQIEEDPETFESCIDTIIRQVETIGRMVQEFSSFARMPEAIKSEQNILGIFESSLNLQRQAYPDIMFEMDATKLSATTMDGDRDLLNQAFTNLLLNAVDAVNARKDEGKKFIKCMMYNDKNETHIIIEDNGIGLPADKSTREKLLEPYITTKEKGTGLGLAIVKKIIEDHGGTLKISDRMESGKVDGARIVITFPLNSVRKVA